jgi:tetratricopeptide (TPR) repeat protein
VSVNWGELVAWKHRSDRFGRLLVHGEFRKSVVMELEPTSGDWGGGRELWLTLPRHPNIFEALDASGERGVLLRYAAIDWIYDLDQAPQEVIATWGVQLVAVYSFLLENCAEHIGLFTQPFVEVDIGGHIRVGFLPLEHPRWSRAQRAGPEAEVMHTIGTLLMDLSGRSPHEAVARIARRCIKSQYKSGAQLESELRMAGASHAAIRSDFVLQSWRLAEEGLGWLQVDEPGHAQMCFRRANADLAYQAITSWGLEQASVLLGKDPPNDFVSSDPTIKTGTIVTRAWSWAEAEDEGLRHESKRDFAAALHVYNQCNPGSHDGAMNTARARCYLQLGQLAHALECAQLAFLRHATDVETCELYISTLLKRRSFDEALSIADYHVGLDPSRGRAHYLRGKALFALGRMVDARDAFARATVLDPKLIEAQLLRREVERVTGNVRQTVGTQHAPSFDIPEQLADLRDVLISGDTNAAITALRDDRYARDADAQLLLARLLAFDKRLDEAIVVYDQLAATSHRSAALVGKANALLELGRAGDALSIVEQLPDDADAAEVQARALEALQRVEEAAEAYRRFIALASSGSDLRVRAAQLALDDLAQRRRQPE